MADVPLRITRVTTDADWNVARAVRQEVFVEEQDCPPAEEWDGYDATSRHLVGRVDGEGVATSRWREVDHDGRRMAKLERFAVRKRYRGAGYGRDMVQATLDDARSAGHTAFILHAQSHLEAFYASFGFTSTDRRFTEVGIPHVEMVLGD